MARLLPKRAQAFEQRKLSLPSLPSVAALMAIS
jgi:hypothetical protein